MFPPTIAILAVITMIVLHVVAPIMTVVRAPFSYAGIVPLVTGTIMILWSRRAFQTAGTSITPFTESTTLVRHGLYRWSRNPTGGISRSRLQGRGLNCLGTMIIRGFVP